MTSKPAKARVTAFADHDVIEPSQTLTHFAKPARGAGQWDAGLDLEAIARAEAALGELSKEFDGWMTTECERLDAARRALTSGGLSRGSLDVLFRAAHDIKGEAATFGYPLATELAASLCRLLMHVVTPGQLPVDLVDRHVAAIRAIVREQIHDEANETASEVLIRLQELTEAALLEQHRDDPAWLAEQASPSTVPTADDA